MTKQERIKRTREWPFFMKVREDSRVKLKLLQCPAPDYSLCYHRSRWIWIGEPSQEEKREGPFVRRRCYFAWITHKKGQRIGALEFIIYEPSPLIDEMEFLYIMDGDSHWEAELSATICNSWEYATEEVLDYGPVLVPENAWIDPAFSRFGLLSAAVKLLLSVIQEEYSILICKAFPIEYEGRLPDWSKHRVAFERRRIAMVDYYSKALGVSLLPGFFGSEGWLWRASERVAGIIPPPTPYTPDVSS